MQSVLILAALMLPLVGLLLSSKRRLALSAVVLSTLCATALIFLPGTVRFDWVPELGISLSLGFTPLSLPFFLLTEILLLVALALAWREPHFPGVLAFGWSMLLIFAAQDLILFLIGWGLALVIGFFLLARDPYLSTRFALFQGTALMLLMAVFVGMIVSAGNSASFDRLLAVKPLTNAPLWLVILLFVAFTVACLIPMGVFPFSPWLSDLREVPCSSFILVLGAWTKVGIYGFLLFGAGMFPTLMRAAVPWLVALGLLTLLGGAFVSMTQRQMRPFLIQVTVAFSGLSLIGVFSGQLYGYEGAILLALSHGLAIAALSSLPPPHALWPRRPRIAMLVLLGCLALLGFPGFLGFPAVAFLFSGGWAIQPWVGVCMALGMGILLTATVLFFTGFAGEGEGQDGWRMSPWFPLLLSLLFGVLPPLLVGPLGTALLPMMPLFGF